MTFARRISIIIIAFCDFKIIDFRIPVAYYNDPHRGAPLGEAGEPPSVLSGVWIQGVTPGGSASRSVDPGGGTTLPPGHQIHRKYKGERFALPKSRGGAPGGEQIRISDPGGRRPLLPPWTALALRARGVSQGGSRSDSQIQGGRSPPCPPLQGGSA